MVDSNKMNWWTIGIAVFSIIVSIFAIISSLYSISLTKDVEIKLSQYESTSDLQIEMISALSDYEYLLQELGDKYNDSSDTLYSKVTIKEKQKINEMIERINILLAKTYVFYSDDEYNYIKNTPIIGKFNVRDLREKLLVAMRKVQYPDTILEQEDIRFIYKIK